MKDDNPEFTAAMFEVYRRAKDEAGYNATIFLGMLSKKNGLHTAKYLINAPKESEGYANLYERGRLDLTVEALVVESKRWRELFTPDEIRRAETRLKCYNYSPQSPS